MSTRAAYVHLSHEQDEKRRQAIREDYEWLIRTGETHSQRVAQRLGFPSVATLDRYLHRAGIPIRHCDPVAGWRVERARQAERRAA